MSRPILSRQDRADAFRGMAHPLRRRVMWRLSRGEASVSELRSRLKVTFPTLSQHLAILRETGLVTQRLVGQRRIYRLRETAVRQARQWIAQVQQRS